MSSESMDQSQVRALLRGDYVPKQVAKPVGTTTPQRFHGRDNTKYGKRHKPGVMNGTESEYAARLDARADVRWWVFESVTLKLADKCRYSPDFAVQLADGSIEFIDAKGGGPIDPKSIVKIKVAAEKFPQFLFVIEQKLSKKMGGCWKRTEY